MEELDSEAAFIRKEGFVRKNPQENSVPILKCKQCNIIFKKNKRWAKHIF